MSSIRYNTVPSITYASIPSITIPSFTIPSYTTPGYSFDINSYYSSLNSAYGAYGFTDLLSPFPTNPASQSAYVSSVLSQQSALLTSQFRTSTTSTRRSSTGTGAFATRTSSSSDDHETETPTPSRRKGSRAWIAGAVIGGLVGLFLILGAIAFAYHKGQKKRKLRESGVGGAGMSGGEMGVGGPEKPAGLTPDYTGPAASELGGKSVGSTTAPLSPQYTSSSQGYPSELSSGYVPTQPTGSSAGLVSELSSPGARPAPEVQYPVYSGPPVELPAGQAGK